MNSKKKIKVLVLMGGPSAEQEVSLSTGREVVRALDRKKYIVRSTVIPRAGFKNFNVQKFKSLSDVAFIAMHGEYGEDGRLQALLDLAEIPYVGSGVTASAIAMDKVKSAKLFRADGLSVPRQIPFSKNEWRKNPARVARAIAGLGFPLVIKPADRGSSVGITIVSKFKSLTGAVRLAIRYSPLVLAEEFIRGRELTCGVLEDPATGVVEPLLPIEIIPRKGAFYDYQSKYAEGGSEHLIPPRMPKTIIQKIQQAALTAHQALGCRGMSRTDFIVQSARRNTQSVKIYILETNTLPGMTATSLLPQAAAASKISFPKLLDKLIAGALRSHT